MKKTIVLTIFVAFGLATTGNIVAENVKLDIPEDYNAVEILNETTFRKPISLSESISITSPDDYNVSAVLGSKDRLGSLSVFESSQKFWGPDDYKIE